MDKKLVTFQLLLLLSSVSARSSGADSSACGTLIPGHSPHQPQPSPSPYSVVVSDTQYSAGKTLTVTLSGIQSFKGFLLVATNSSTDITQTVGTLSGARTEDSANTKNICPGNTHLTHNKQLTTDNVQITWTAPAEIVGNVYFYASFVEEYKTFWIRVPSPGIWDGVSEQPPTTTVAPTEGTRGTLQGDVTLDGCVDGTKSCWRSCNDQNECDYLVTFIKDSANPDKYLFEVFASNVDGYVAVGIAPGPSMKDVSIVACINDESAAVQQFYAEGQNDPEPIAVGPITGSKSEFRYNIGKKTMTCKFTYDNSVAKDSPKWKDLSKDTHTLLLARGLYFSPKIAQHATTPERSPLVDFNIISDISGSVALPLVKAHGALMILAWVLCASIGIIMARFYKPMWVEKKACGQKVWFQVHRAFMLIAMVISLIAFVLILIHKQGVYNPFAQELPLRAHPILGLIAIICSLLNPLIAAFRCHPGDKKRPIFNWFHWFFGTVAHVFAVVAIFIGMMYSSAEVPYWLVYVMMAYALVHFLVELILEIQNCCMYDKNRDRQEQFELTGKGPGSTATEPPFAGRNFRCAMLVIYLILVPILALVMVFVVAFVRG